MDKNNKVYSYHTFFFPFVWSNGGNVHFDDYTKMAEDMKWEDISIGSFADIERVKEKGMTPKQTYQVVQYFTAAARASMFGWGKNFVRYYAYSQDEVHNSAVYHIKSGSYTYDLKINGIKLRVFNTGVAVFSIEAENTEYRTIDDVKRINEFGRRIFAPFFVDGYCFECADELGIYGINESNKITMVATTQPQGECECIPNFIRELLPCGTIKPAIDDRMFVACCVSDGKYAEQIKQYKDNREISKDLYELIYVDKPDNCSCPSDTMREKLLDESIYDRWMELGTIHAVSHHSMICVNNGVAEHINFSFIAIYTHMIATVLAQRAAIIVFDEISSQLADEKSSSKNAKEITHFQKKYITFCNQHNNIEITCQEQGVEIYELLQKAMYVKENNDKLEREVDILYETASISADLRLNTWGIILAVIFGVAQILPFLPELLSLLSELLLRIFKP